MSNKKNPWLGWSPYDESSMQEGYRFVGRTTETSELFSLIDNNLLVTLYGKSGIGKSSVLEAGVFPALRAANYMPVICRSEIIQESSNTAKYPQSIIDQIIFQCSKHSIMSNYENSVTSNLVEFFQDSSFTKDGMPVFPVLVFDQFEDWFKNNKEAANQLLSDISYLISNDYNDITNYRFVISIREDYLYILEDNIDNHRYYDLKQNRYRLTEMNKAQAEEILDLGITDDSIRSRILEISKRNLGYDPGLISFYCHELFDIFPDEISDRALTYVENENFLIEQYYDRCFNNRNLSSSTKRYIENHLQEKGVKKTQNLSIIEECIPKKEREILFEGSTKLLRKYPIGNTEQVELIHDRIAEIINNRQSKIIEIQRNRSILVSLLIYFTGIGFFVWNIILNLMHASEACMGNNTDKKVWIFLNSIFQSDQFQTIISKMHIAASTLILSQELGYAMLLIMMIIIIPICICKLFYNTLRLKGIFIPVLATIVSYILSSDWFLRFNITKDSYLFIANGWAILFCLFITSLIKTTNKNSHSNG